MENKGALVVIFGIPSMLTVIILSTLVVASTMLKQDFPPIRVEIMNSTNVPKDSIHVKMEKPEVTIREITNEKNIVSPITMENHINVPEIKIPQINVDIPKTEVTVIQKSEKIAVADDSENLGKLLPPPRVK